MTWIVNFNISQYIEKRTRSGDVVVTGIEESGQGLGFCLDFTPDKTVGVAMEWLLVGSQDVAHDCARLKELGVTHILNVAYGVPNAFTDVSLIAVELKTYNNIHNLICLFLILVYICL